MNKATVINTAGKVPLLSHFLRWTAARYPEGSVVEIGSGFAKGLKWKRSHRYVNGYWLGNYELEIQTAVNRLLSKDAFFLDIGANAGFFSLIAANCVGPQGKCVSVDPDPINRQNMTALIELNGLTNWSVLQLAVAQTRGTVRFAAAPGSPTGHFAKPDESENVFDVEVTTIDEICREHGRPSLIKMDIEGAEAQALKGAVQTLQDWRPTWLIELHGVEVAAQTRKILSEAGYRFETLAGEDILDTCSLGHHVIARP